MADFIPGEAPDDFLQPEEEEEPTTVALVSTMEPLELAVDVIDDDLIPDGMVGMGSFLDGRLIARSAVSPKMFEDIRSRDAFSSPVRVALVAVERDPGLQCRLFALLPAEHFQEDDEPSEPWMASVPRFEEQEELEEEQEAVVPLLLGHIVRFATDRKHPEDLAAEAADVLQTILADDRPLSNVVDKLLDDLLDD
jgi:hypothetical protein